MQQMRVRPWFRRTSSTIRITLSQVYAYFSSHPWTVALLNASEPAMDMFMVLTGFLAAQSLVPALEAAPSPSGVVARRAATS